MMVTTEFTMTGDASCLICFFVVAVVVKRSIILTPKIVGFLLFYVRDFVNLFVWGFCCCFFVFFFVFLLVFFFNYYYMKTSTGGGYQKREDGRF